MASAWLITLPASAIVGGLLWILSHEVGLATTELIGVLAAFLVLLVLVGFILGRSLRAPVTSDNVNADWENEPTEKIESDGRDHGHGPGLGVPGSVSHTVQRGL